MVHCQLLVDAMTNNLSEPDKLIIDQLKFEDRLSPDRRLLAVLKIKLHIVRTQLAKRFGERPICPFDFEARFAPPLAGQ